MNIWLPSLDRRVIIDRKGTEFDHKPPLAQILIQIKEVRRLPSQIMISNI